MSENENNKKDDKKKKTIIYSTIGGVVAVGIIIAILLSLLKCNGGSTSSSSVVGSSSGAAPSQPTSSPSVPEGPSSGGSSPNIPTSSSSGSSSSSSGDTPTTTGHSVTWGSLTNGNITITSEKSTGIEQWAKVTFTVNPEVGYCLGGNPELVDSKGESITVTSGESSWPLQLDPTDGVENGYEFFMPDCDVVIKVNFTQIETVYVEYKHNGDILGEKGRYLKKNVTMNDHIPAQYLGNTYQGLVESINIHGDYTSIFCTFSGWNTKADGKGRSFTANEILNFDIAKTLATQTINPTITLYAQWTGKSVKVKYDLNGGNIDGNTTISDGSYTYGGKFADVEGKNPIIVDTDKVFLGWRNNIDFKIDKDSTIYETSNYNGFEYVAPKESGDDDGDDIYNVNNYCYSLKAYWSDKKLGTYPQSKVDDDLATTLSTDAGLLKDGTYINLPTNERTTLDNDSGLYKCGDWVSYDYYYLGKKGSEKDGTHFMWYMDKEYDNEKYRAVYFNQYRQTDASGVTSNWTSITGEEYHRQNTDGYLKSDSTNTYIYWFKYEPILWKVTDESFAYKKGSNSSSTSTDTGKLLITANILDSQHFYHGAERVDQEGTKETRAPYDSQNTEDVYDDNYKYSDIRGWLNTTFMKTSSLISDTNVLTTKVNNSSKSIVFDDYGKTDTDYSALDAYACADTEDKAFLISSNELFHYYMYYNHEQGTGEFKPERVAYPTDYALCQGLTSSEGVGAYLCRSPSANRYRSIKYYGYDESLSYSEFTNFSDYCDDTSIGVRPMITYNAL